MELIIAFFLVFLLLREFDERICAICLAVGMTWVVLLALLWLGYYNDKVMIALLMGMSITGTYYLLGNVLKPYRLPIVLTLLLIAYGVLSRILWRSVAVVTTLWILTFLLTRIGRAKRLVARLIACCRDW